MCVFVFTTAPVVMNLHLFSDRLFEGVEVREWVTRAAGTALGSELLPWFLGNRFGKTDVQ